MQIPLMPVALDWEQLIIFLFIVGSSLIGRLMQANQKRGKRPGRAAGQPKPPVQPFGGQPPPVDAPPVEARGAAPANPQERLEQEIEAFLRKAAPNRKNRPPGRTAAPPAVPGQAPSRKPAGSERAPLRKSQPREMPSQQARKTGASRRATDSIRSGETVEQHVQQHLRRPPQQPKLARQLEQSDERVEERLHEVFDHTLGNLSDSRGSISQGTDAQVWTPTRDETPLAEQLFSMLASPSKVGAAIVLSEILRRPDERWPD